MFTPLSSLLPEKNFNTGFTESLQPFQQIAQLQQQRAHTSFEQSQAREKQTEADQFPVIQQLNMQHQQLSNKAQQLSNQYYAKATMAKIAYENAQASLMPSERTSHYAQANYFSAEAQKAQADANTAIKQQQMFSSMMDDVHGSPKVVDENENVISGDQTRPQVAPQVAPQPTMGETAGFQYPVQQEEQAPPQAAPSQVAPPQAAPPQAAPPQAVDQQAMVPEAGTQQVAPSVEQQPQIQPEAQPEGQIQPQLAPAPEQPTQPSVAAVPQQPSAPTKEDVEKQVADQPMTYNEPENLRQDRMNNSMTNVLTMMGKKPNELFVKQQSKQLDEYYDKIKDVSKSANNSAQLLNIVDQMRVAYNKVPLSFWGSSKGTPLANQYFKYFDDNGQTVEMLSNNAVLQRIAEVSGMGRTLQSAFKVLQNSKATLAQKPETFNRALNIIQSVAIMGRENLDLLTAANITYKNNKYGAAIPIDTAEKMYDNYRDNHPVLDNNGNLIYRTPNEDGSLNKYAGLGALYAASSGNEFNARIPDIKESTIQQYMQKYPNKNRGMIIAALRKANIKG